MKTGIRVSILLALASSAGAQVYDFGDLPDSPYPTKLPNGARHITSQNLFIGGAAADAEADGSPDANATGDDLNGVDDEDGVNPSLVRITAGVPYTFRVKVTNTTGNPAYLRGFADWNQDGDFADADETATALVPTGSNGVFVPLTFAVPSAAVTGIQTALRLRISDDNNLPPIGAAQLGEVEDALIPVQPPGFWKDFGDLPDVAAGTASGTLFTASPPDYKTLAADGGASHGIHPGLYFFDVSAPGIPPVDAEPDGWQSAAANGDDTHDDPDEQGLTITSSSSTFVHDGAASYFEHILLAGMTAMNTTGNPATVTGFVDANSDGDFDDPGERAYDVVIPSSGATAYITLLFKFKVPATPPATSFTKHFGMRFRITTDSVVNSTGPATDGEVMDTVHTYQFSVPPDGYDPMDFGDLAGPHPTTRAADGARHFPNQSIFLGSVMPDGESDGAPSAAADGDNVNAVNDEDSVNPSTIQPVPGFDFNMPVTATNMTGSAATLSGFVDWNGDGDFLDAGEFSTKTVPTGASAGTFKLKWSVPLTAVTTGPVALRLRLATGGVLPPTGPAENGEVEDFMIQTLAQGVDYGDLPDSIAGSAAGDFLSGSPPDYQTRAADGGPSHIMTPGLYLVNDGSSGDAHLDPESDGQPSSAADGDNTAGDNDELLALFALTKQTFVNDGTHSRFDLELFSSHAASNASGSTAHVTSFIDANNDGDFDDPGESTTQGGLKLDLNGDGDFTDAGETTGSSGAWVTLDIPAGVTSCLVEPVFTFSYELAGLPASPVTKKLAVRTRITTDPGIGPNGPASDGEVQDDLVQFTMSWDSIVLEDLVDYGDLDNARYPTLWASDGARHVIGQSLFIGSVMPDGEADGNSSLTADGDDSHGTDDEDGFDSGGIIAVQGQPVDFPVTVTNNKTTAATLYGFVDWNDDGDVADAGETSSVVVPAGSSGVVVNLPWTVPVTASTSASLALRLRLSTVSGLGFSGLASDGEVEDYQITLTSQFDFGDLTEPQYATTLSNNGPRHPVSQAIYLGAMPPDTEADGLPSPGASGDDTDAINDEDGINPALVRPVVGFSFPMRVKATNVTGGMATLMGFADWNNDGDFADADETASVPVPNGTTGAIKILPFNVPSTAVTTAPVALRLRLAKGGPLPPNGFGNLGEVEDFRIQVMDQGFDFGDLPDSVAGTAAGTFGTASPPDYKTRAADGGPSHVMRPGLLFADPGTIPGNLDAESDGQPDSTATGDNLSGDDDEIGLFSAILRQTIVPDGSHSTATLTLMLSHGVINTTGDTAYVTCFLDTNSDGDFDDAGETTTVGYKDLNGDSDTADPGEDSVPMVVPGDGSVTSVAPRFTIELTNLTSPPLNLTFAVRSRITTDTGIGADGPASDGEVQDDLVSMTISWDSNGLAMDYGDLDNSRYPSLWANNGARHVVSQQLYIGSLPTDAENDGISSSLADGDDTTTTDDEDAVDTATHVAWWGQPFNLPVLATNSGTTGATLYGFADWNDDGDFSDAGETASVPVAAFTTSGLVTLPFNVPATPLPISTVALRLRIGYETSLAASGLGGPGEVEDCLIEVKGGWDFGDLPDAADGTLPGVVVDLSTSSHADYRTRLADNGPRHLIRPDLVLYNDRPWYSGDPPIVHVDAESDGNPTSDASGDDYSADDDEEVMYSAVMKMQFVLSSPYDGTAKVRLVWVASVAVKNETGTTAYIDAFADANNDGDFNDPGEKGVLDLNYDGDVLDAGESALVEVPSAPGFTTRMMTFSRLIDLNTYIPSWTMRIPHRFRLSTAGSLSPDGPAADGEVEDYEMSISCASDDWRPRLFDRPSLDWVLDSNGPAWLASYNVTPPQFMSSQNIKWHIGDSEFFGNFVSLSPSQLQSFGVGVKPYFISTEFYPQHLGAYLGFLRIENMSGFRGFMNQYSLTDGFSQPDEDADGDGVTNFTEYAFGTNPSVESLPPILIPRVVQDGPEKYLVGSYPRLPGGSFSGAVYSTPEVSYRPSASADLLDWSKPVAPATAPPGLPAPPAGYEWGAVRIAAPVSSSSKGFLQMEAGVP